MRFHSLIEALPSNGGIAFGDVRLSTSELTDLAARAAADLRHRGIRPGDPVAGMLDNGPAFVALWFGAAIAGAVFIPINARLRGETLRHILEDSSPKLVITDSLYRQPLADVLPQRSRAVESTAWLEDLRTASPSPRNASGGGLIIYTSGTTGRPKGVHWTTETQARHAVAYSQELVRIAQGENAYSCLPMFHVTCMGVTLASLIHGATVHIDPRFSATGFWSRIVQTRAVFFPYVGSVLSILLKDPQPAPEHAVRDAMGAAAPSEVYVRFQERFGIRLLETYGQTELGSIWLANHDARVAGSVGKGCVRADFRLMPVEGIEGSGELQVRPRETNVMMSGYHGNQAATDDAWTDGWYRTRDLLSIDENGNYRFVGRLADCVRRRGENVSCFEVEQAVLVNPRVVEAAVVGIDSDLGEQDLALYYIERHAGALPPAELDTWCRMHLSDFMVPRYYVPVAEFAKTETQRVQKGILHDRVKLRGGYDAERKVNLE